MGKAGAPSTGFDPLIRAIVGEALSSYMFDRAVSLAVVGEDNRTVVADGSGFCITIGGRYFIGTAAHVARWREDFTIFIMSTTEPRDLAIKTVAHGACGHEASFVAEDIGWIEITAAAARASQRTFMTLADVQLNAASLGSGFIHLMGAPGERTEHLDFRGKPLRKRVALPYFTNVTSPGPGTQVHPDADIYVAWGAEYVRDTPAGQETVKAPSADGMSGGPIWASPSLEAGKVWVANPKLVGVIRSSLAGTWIRGTQIHRWLRMLAADIPELRNELEAALSAAI